MQGVNKKVERQISTQTVRSTVGYLLSPSVGQVSGSVRKTVILRM
jgi:hypothetical protein